MAERSMQSIKPLDWPPEIYPKHLLILKEVLGAAMLSLYRQDNGNQFLQDISAGHNLSKLLPAKIISTLF
jgi:hypothetical protein